MDSTVSEKRPEIRCRIVRNRLRVLDSYDSQVKNRILGKISKTTLMAIQSVPEDNWIPIEYNVEITEQIAAELGEAGIYELGAKSFELSIESAFIAPFIRAALTLAKIRPNLLMRLAPQFWKSIHRNCGDVLLVEKEPGYVQIVLNDLPPVMARSRNHMISVAAFIQAFSPYSEIQGSSVLEQLSVKTNSAVIGVKWNPSS